MATFNTSLSAAAAAILQQDYLPGLRAQLNSDTVLRDRLRRAPRHQFKGNQLQMAAHSGRGVTHVIDAGVTDTLPPRSIQSFSQLTYDVVSIGQRIAFSRDALMRTRNAPDGAFVELMATEMEGARDDLGQEINRQMFGDSTGQLAQIQTAQSAGSVNVHVDSTRFLRDGEPVKLADSAGAQASTGSDNTISSITDGTNFVLAVAASFETTDFIYHRRGTGPTSAIATEDMFGLQAIIATTNPGAGNLGELAVAGNNFWKGGVLDNGGTNRPLSTKLMKNGLLLAWRRGGNPTLGITSDATFLEYGSLILADKRFPSDPFVTLDGGFTGLSFSGVPIVPDKDAPANELLFVTEKDLLIAEPQEATFEDADGSILFRVAGAHQFEALLYIFTQLAAKRRNSHSRITDIQENNQTHNL